jgi:hypothetical protein
MSQTVTHSERISTKNRQKLDWDITTAGTGMGNTATATAGNTVWWEESPVCRVSGSQVRVGRMFTSSSAGGQAAHEWRRHQAWIHVYCMKSGYSQTLSRTIACTSIRGTFSQGATCPCIRVRSWTLGHTRPYISYEEKKKKTTIDVFLSISRRYARTLVYPKFLIIVKKFKEEA